jgi:hypothetical protein
MSVEIDDDAGGATVVLRFSDGELRASCSCGRPGCAHLEAAIAAAATASTLGASSGPASVAPVSLSSPRESAQLRPDPAALALRTLLEALLRAAAGEVTAAVDEALRSASAEVAERSLAGASRVLGRITASLGSRGSASESALAIAALGETVAALEGARSDAVHAEASGLAVEEARLEDLELVELARARERGVVRWERRLLVDPQSGALYREEGASRSASLSGGVAGRRLVVSLASRLVSREPSRVTLLQYALEPAAPSATLARAASVASRSLALPSDVVASPLISVASPRLVWLAPEHVDFAGGRATLTDEDGASLELDRDAATEALRDRVASGATVRALAGALRADVGGFRLEAWSAVVDAARGPELVALAF